MDNELLICVNRRISAESCAGRGSEAVAQALEEGIRARNLPIRLRRIHCFGRCRGGPNLRLAGRSFYEGVGPEDVVRILDEMTVELRGD